MNDIFRELKKNVDFDFGDNDVYTVVSQMLDECGKFTFNDQIMELIKDET